MSVKIAASILAADYGWLQEQVVEALDARVEYLHVDVMDGHFVPNITNGPLIVEAIRPMVENTSTLIDVHLMIENPGIFIPEFIKAGANSITVHVETCTHLQRCIQIIKDLGARAGVTLNPATPIVSLEEVIQYVDMVLVMSVNPGFGGQKFLPASFGRVARVREMLEGAGLKSVEIEVDGGVIPGNSQKLVDAGATILVSGSGIFNTNASVLENVEAFRAAVN